MKNFCEDLFFFLRLRGPWPRAFLSLASRVSVLGKAVLGLGLGFFFVSLALASSLVSSTQPLLFTLAIKFDCLFLTIFQSFHLFVGFIFDKLAPPPMNICFKRCFKGVLKLKFYWFIAFETKFVFLK